MNNFNFNKEMERNLNYKVKGGKVYIKLGNKYILHNLSPSKKYTKNQININGPRSKKLNNNKIKNAMNVLNAALSKQFAVAPAANRKQFLNPGYVYNTLKSVGLHGFKNYSATSKNNKTLRGFAIIHNSPSTGNRIVNVLVTHSGEGTGKLVMNRIIRNARANGKTVIRLQSVKSAIPFYNKFGFVSQGNANGLVPMKLQLKN
jgi:GNAT superfamily N-acetyltransferase